MEKPQIMVHIEKAVNFTLFDSHWIPCSSRIVALGSLPRGTGIIQIYEMSKGELNLTREIENPKAFKCGTFAASTLSHRHLATGDFEGNLNLWDLEHTAQPIYSVSGHSSIINSIDGIGGMDIGAGSAEVVTGGRDGSVKVWDVRQKDRPVAIMEPEDGHPRRDCWSVAFGNAYTNNDRMLCSGYDNGDLKMFDLRSMQLYWELNTGQGVCSIEFDRKDIEMNKLTVCTLNSGILVYDLRTKHPTKGFANLKHKAHKSTIWVGRHLPQNRDVFMTCGGNGSMSLWKYNYPSSRTAKHSDGNLEGVAGTLELLREVGISGQPITAFNWNNNFTGLGLCTSFDQVVRVIAVTGLNRI